VEKGEFDETGVNQGEGGGVLNEGSRGTLDPFSVDEKAGVDGRLACEEVVVKLGAVDGWHGEKQEEERRGDSKDEEGWLKRFIFGQDSRSGGTEERDFLPMGTPRCLLNSAVASCGKVTGPRVSQT
jgi:hypothetical protein